MVVIVRKNGLNLSFCAKCLPTVKLESGTAIVPCTVTAMPKPDKFRE